jgi:hypothetical protein
VEQAEYVSIVRWDDSRLLRWREDAKEELERNPNDEQLRRLYDASTAEVTSRARMRTRINAAGGWP